MFLLFPLFLLALFLGGLFVASLLADGLRAARDADHSLAELRQGTDDLQQERSSRERRARAGAAQGEPLGPSSPAAPRRRPSDLAAERCC